MKRNIIKIMAAVAVLAGGWACGANTAGTPADGEGSVLDVIFERKSVRSYADRAVEQEKVDILVRAAMSAPSGMDRRPWEIVVVDDRETLDLLAETGAKMVTEAPLAIVICGDTDKSSYWYLDCSAATQNLLLAAEAQGLGAVWTAAYPYEDRMGHVINALGLPANVLPLAVVPVGYPSGDNTPKDKYDPSKVHTNKW
ncbi:MAG: nitroreductase family protein [Alistipes sp.]|nr:nitroreductase family protein [Alistipes sp.]